MSSVTPLRQSWVKTSIPRVIADNTRGTYRLRLQFTPGKGKKTIIKTSPAFTSKKEAEEAADAWRTEVEDGKRDMLSESSGWATGKNSSVKLPQGKSRNSMGRLNAVQERAYKKQRLEYPGIQRDEWMKCTSLTDREKGFHTREMDKRKKKVTKKIMARRAYLGSRIVELEARAEETKDLIDRLCTAMTQDITILLENVSIEDGTEAGDLADGTATEENTSGAQRLRLYQQAAVTSEVLKQLRDRDLLQMGLYQQAHKVIEVEEATGTSVEEMEAKVWPHMNDASLIRHQKSLLLIAAGLAENMPTKLKPSTILSWVREFRKLRGHFKRDCRGVHERGWILCEEDLQLQLLEWLKCQKRVSTAKTQEYINNVLLGGEGGNPRLAKYGLTLPISSTTVHSWMMKLGCKYDRAGQSYYTHGHERSDVV